MDYIIKLRRDGRSLYYKHTSEGTPILGEKKGAAKFPPDLARTVLSHLKIMDAAFEKAELVEP